MSAELPLRMALSSIDDAKTKLKRLRDKADSQAYHDMQRVISDLDSAANQIRKAMDAQQK